MLCFGRGLRSLFKRERERKIKRDRETGIIALIIKKKKICRYEREKEREKEITNESLFRFAEKQKRRARTRISPFFFCSTVVSCGVRAG